MRKISGIKIRDFDEDSQDEGENLTHIWMKKKSCSTHGLVVVPESMGSRRQTEVLKMNEEDDEEDGEDEASDFKLQNGSEDSVDTDEEVLPRDTDGKGAEERSREIEGAGSRPKAEHNSDGVISSSKDINKELDTSRSAEAHNNSSRLREAKSNNSIETTRDTAGEAPWTTTEREKVEMKTSSAANQEKPHDTTT
mmetsp:Transcript_28147/g.45316  ORF Transcript_28147/g.45316 Transcript_28147/m.45316 type:complete len:195 (+) Transcript_28147:67-651(+)